MIEFVVVQWFALLVGGLIVALAIVARDRRKAVDRLVDQIENCKCPPRPEDWRQWLKSRVEWQGHYGHWLTDAYVDNQDAPGRQIARSVKRVTKG